MASDPGGVPVRQLTPEVLAGIAQLGIDPTDERLMKLVDDLLRPESLPKGWAAAWDAALGTWSYTHAPSGTAAARHPCYGYYQGAVFLDKGGYAALKANRAAYPPTEEEVSSMASYLGLQEEEEDYVWEVAEMALAAPLPPHWEEGPLPPEAPGEPSPGLGFRNTATGEVLAEHPLDSYFRELVRRRRRDLMRRKKAALKAVAAVCGAGAKRGSNPAPVPPQQLDALVAEWGSVLNAAQQLVAGLQAALPLTTSSCTVGPWPATTTELAATAARGGGGVGAGAGGEVATASAVLAGGVGADSDGEYSTALNCRSSILEGNPSSAAACGGGARVSSIGAAVGGKPCCCPCHADVSRWLVAPGSLSAGADVSRTSSSMLPGQSSASLLGAAGVGGSAGGGGADAGTVAWRSRRSSSISVKLTQIRSVLSSAVSAEDQQQQQQGSTTGAAAASLGGFKDGAAGQSGQSLVNSGSRLSRPSLTLSSLAPRQSLLQSLWAATNSTNSTSSSAANTNGAGSTTTTSNSSNGGSHPAGFLSSATEVAGDTGEGAALAHMGAVKAVLNQALGCLGDWQQQQLVLRALQTQQQQAQARLAARSARVSELEAVLAELERSRSNLQGLLDMQQKQGGDLIATLQQQLQSKESSCKDLETQCKDLEAAVAQLQQQLAEAQQQAGRDASAAAAALEGVTTQLSEAQQQLAAAQQQAGKDAAEAAAALEGVTTQLFGAQQQAAKDASEEATTLQQVTTQLFDTQQQLAAAQQQVASLQQLNSTLSGDADSAAASLTGQLEQARRELTEVQEHRGAALLELEGLKAAAAEAAARSAAMEADLLAAQQQAASLQQEVATLTAQLEASQQAAAAAAAARCAVRPSRTHRGVQVDLVPRSPNSSSQGGPQGTNGSGSGSGGWRRGALPEVAQQRGLHTEVKLRSVVVPVRRDSGGWDSSPIPAQVRSRVDRAKDRELKLKRAETAANFAVVTRGTSPSTAGVLAAGDAMLTQQLTGWGSSFSGGLSQNGSSSLLVPSGVTKGRWEYAIDERDAEILGLKQRLVELERRHREAALRAESDVKRLGVELQSAYKCLGSVGVSQSGGFDLQQAAATLRATLSQYGGSRSSQALAAAHVTFGGASHATSSSSPGGLTSSNSPAAAGGSTGWTSNSGGWGQSSALAKREGASAEGEGTRGSVRFSSFFPSRTTGPSTAVAWPSLLTGPWGGGSGGQAGGNSRSSSKGGGLAGLGQRASSAAPAVTAAPAAADEQ